MFLQTHTYLHVQMYRSISHGTISVMKTNFLCTDCKLLRILWFVVVVVHLFDQLLTRDCIVCSILNSLIIVSHLFICFRLIFSFNYVDTFSVESIVCQEDLIYTLQDNQSEYSQSEAGASQIQGPAGRTMGARTTSRISNQSSHSKNKRSSISSLPASLLNLGEVNREKKKQKELVAVVIATVCIFSSEFGHCQLLKP